MKKEYDFSKGIRGKFYRPQKVQKTLRLDADILLYFQEQAVKKSTGYQTLINNTLREAMRNVPGLSDLQVLRREIRAAVQSALKG